MNYNPKYLSSCIGQSDIALFSLQASFDDRCLLLVIMILSRKVSLVILPKAVLYNHLNISVNDNLNTYLSFFSDFGSVGIWVPYIYENFANKLFVIMSLNS